MINPDPNDIDPSSNQSTTEAAQKVTSAEVLDAEEAKASRRLWLEHPETKKVLRELELARQDRLVFIENNAYRWEPIGTAISLEGARMFRHIAQCLVKQIPFVLEPEYSNNKSTAIPINKKVN